MVSHYFMSKEYSKACILTNDTKLVATTGHSCFAKKKKHIYLQISVTTINDDMHKWVIGANFFIYNLTWQAYLMARTTNIIHLYKSYYKYFFVQHSCLTSTKFPFTWCIPLNHVTVFVLLTWDLLLSYQYIPENLQHFIIHGSVCLLILETPQSVVTLS